MGDQPIRRTGTAHIPKALPHMMSRWYGGVSTFGPVGRIGWTLLTFSVPAWFIYLFLTAGIVAILIAIPVLTVWFGWLIPLMMKDIWAKDAFYVPEPRVPTTKQMLDAYGTRVPTMEEFVAGQAETALD
jgi:hypothetical protein